MTHDRVLWIITFANPGIVLGIMWNMTQKPGTVEAIVAVAIGYAVGAALALRFTKMESVEAAAAVDPTT
jgi:tryptophan-rich sensory protein